MASLLEQIEQGALDSKVALADVLRKCIALGGQSGSATLRDWARQELDGYPSASELPDYRKVPALIQLDGHNMAWMIKGETISPSDLPDFTHGLIEEEAPITLGVGEIESWVVNAQDGTIRLTLPRGTDLVRYMNGTSDGSMIIDSIYWSVSASALAGTLDRIRTNLVSIVAEMRASGVGGRDVPPAAVSDQAVNVVVYGAKRSPITVTTANTAGEGHTVTTNPSPPPDNSLWARLRKPGAFLVGAATVIGGVVGVAAWQGWNPLG